MSDDDSSRAPLPLTDRLALDRTLLANERTLLAYIRTAIMLAGSGITLIKLFPDEMAVQGPGWGLLAFSVVVACFGMLRFTQVARPLRKLQHPNTTSN
jgi:putative membrane protein